MGDQAPKVLVLGLKWPLLESEFCTEVDNVAKHVAVSIAHNKQAHVYFTVPYFAKDLSDSGRYRQQRQDASLKNVTLVGAECRTGRRETPDETWITEYLEQHYHDAINPNDGYLQVRFTHIVGFVPSTYKRALEFEERNRDDSLELTKVILIVCDVDAQRTCASDEQLRRADRVFVLGGSGSTLNRQFNSVNSHFQPFMISNSTESVCADNAVHQDSSTQSNTKLGIIILSMSIF